MRLLPFLLLCSTALADGGWVLTTADLKQQPVDLRSFSSSGVEVKKSGADAPQRIALDHFLQIDRPAGAEAAAQKFVLLTLSGDRLFGQPAGYKDEQVLWQSPAVGQLKFPLKQVRAMFRGGKAAPNLDQPRTDDLVMLANGDSLKGLVADIGKDKLKVNANGADVELAYENIDYVHFALAGKPQAATQRAFRIRLTDGSLLTATAAQSEGDKLALAFADKSKAELPLSAVVGIEQLNGPVSWLSSRLPDAAVQTPYFGGTPWPTRMDSTVAGRPITFNGRTYSRGIGVHAYSRLDYVLDGSYEALRAQYAIASDGPTQFADVTVRIKLDGKVVYEAPHIRAGTLAPLVVVDIPKDARKLTLEVDYGDANDTQDHFNWIEPALLRSRALAPTTQP